MIRSHGITQKAKMFYDDTWVKEYSTTVWVWASRAVVQRKKKDNGKEEGVQQSGFLGNGS